MKDNTNLFDFYTRFSNEQACINYLEKVRWGDTRTCPHCNSTKTYRYADGRLFKCGECRKQFTVRLGTIFGESKVPLQKWFLVIYLATSLKKGISSIQVHKYAGVTQKTAWFMLQRIRSAIENDTSPLQLENAVEVDETYVGGKRRGSKRGRGGEHKGAVVGIAQRQGAVRAEATKNTKRKIVSKLIRENVKIGTTVYTDEYPVYNNLSAQGYLHEACNHSQKKYVNGNAHTNTIEGFWSHLKRGIDGVYHHVSKKHLNKYVKEYEYRYNTRALSDFDRFTLWFNSAHYNLSYARLIS
ncbi:hypothetical protein A3B50_02860 [Candidatus Roizmanbacteria bacterium RIFCSPLOWO2_01_FULL_40_42]|uniref:ISXO2-like transposase domain-containing protein n=1 Tax=Candidatus Roizmanbacteria bacterium RIFCSPLOWO2_01_FULL_40_42 TaxID=1802066 RepID=A0A1F7J634_9BACT|nr:MAG: hypothetical protein A2779_03975 [Candidatus Roizmanbacteria bacterium RIFCSPHIGHO2_01_FULL_40_98]OGK28658.1 MAG: hypothetical protein A3C31_01535 [Candidatus Roizmanbacteria bacterium RIFCSPHIGHO2_02_FULL_40_53]OGK36642.1 MAG: hypothetical protein A3E69_00205 [Candidatus Roizmanbacteria bacterium RIFCSPHIGHO2_12_FULL_40_130]OGK51081.1 MAG: hypothetical protein A3B50_02860 [Candidatus Roizmanbacteria bacterium RIFCSPLOWO2_01_FULL_40_42]